MKAIFNNTVIAQSDQTIVIENNHYFPPQSVKMEYLQDSPTTSECPWKGHANYYTVEVDGQTAPDAAWTYKQPKSKAAQIAGYIAFWKGVEVTE